MKKVLVQYQRQVCKIYSRAHSKQQGTLTYAQQRGVAYYRAAIFLLQNLIDSPTPAWVGLVFTHPQRTR
jgi:hypothetical protein